MPRSLTLSAALLIAAFFAAAAPPAHAVTSTTVIITDDGVPVPRASIHIIDIGTNTEIPQDSGADAACGIALNLPAGAYRILVGSSTAGEFSVTGEGEKQVALDIEGGRTPDCKNTKRRTRHGHGRGGRDDRERK